MSTSTTAYVDPMATAIRYCEQQQQQQQQQQPDYYPRLIQSIQDKLWHQCTIIILQHLLSTATTMSKESRYDFYTQVISTIQTKIHPLAYARMVVLIASSSSNVGTNGTEEDQEEDETTKKNSELLSQAHRLLKEQQQQALALLNGNTSTNNSNNSNNTKSIDYGTPTSYVEALLFIQCHQAMATMRHQNNNSNNNNNKTPSVTALRTNIYYPIIQPNATIVQDLMAMTTSTTGTNRGSRVVVDDLVLYESPMVYAAYYEMTMRYEQIVTPYTATFFHHAIQYLQYSPPLPLSTTSSLEPHQLDDQLTLGLHLAWSAICGEGIYHLSYVLEHARMVAIRQAAAAAAAAVASNNNNNNSERVAQFQFVDQLLLALESGNYRQYQQLMDTATSSSLLLVPAASFGSDRVRHMIREKLTLLTLLHVITTTTGNGSSSSNDNNTRMADDDDDDVNMGEAPKEMTTGTGSTTSDRTFTFADLQVALHLKASSDDQNNNNNDDDDLDLEMIVMRAISIGLIRGTIDGISQIVTITYIQPLTTLTQTQLSHLLQQYHHWTNNIQHHITTLQKEAIATK